MRKLVHWIIISIFCALGSVAAPSAMATEYQQSTKKELKLYGIKGKDDRVRVDITENPWRSIGRLNRSGNFCTGVLVGPAQVLTAAHCLWDNRLRKWASPDNIHFVVGYERGNYTGHSKVAKYLLSGNRTPSKKYGKPDVASDWAIATLKEPLGESFGYIPAISINDRDLNNDVTSLSTFVQAGYSKDIPHMLTVHEGCQIESIEKDINSVAAILLHECDATNGDSGSPILMRKGSGFGLVGLHVATYKPVNRGVLGIAISSDQFRDSFRIFLP
ncbi:MAG: trypsin-like serine protease [Sneathiella sp.]|uniref:trypsin-like serine peptidase n=1 Tax=Sneathiella sp. TaxID=1964365 RepID=UPI0030033D14